MNRRAIERTLETLTRTELRALALELADWMGADAVARLVTESPFERSAERPQLQLAAVDTGQASARLAHVRALALAAIRAEGTGRSEIVDTLHDPGLRQGTAAALDGVIDDAVRAVRFDLRAGLELSDEILDTLVRLRHAATVFSSSWTPIRPRLDALVDAIAARVAETALDETTFGMLVQVCRVAETVAEVASPWELVETAVANGRNPAAPRWVVRALERGPDPSAVVPLLRALAGAETSDVDTVVQTAEMHLGAGVDVFEVLVQALSMHGRVDEARFWIGEGRLRHPDAGTWARLESALF